MFADSYDQGGGRRKLHRANEASPLRFNNVSTSNGGGGVIRTVAHP